MKRTVIVLYGGRSAEHEVSVWSAASVLQSIDRQLFDTIPVGISRGGKWVGNVDPRELLADGVTAVPEPPPENGIGRIAHLLSQGDVVFPVLHGTFGEDGAVQGLLEMVDKPYVGAGVTGSALGMDKAHMKAVFRNAGIPCAPYVSTTAHEYKLDTVGFVHKVEESLKYPVFVKPANLGSSVGISKARHREGLLQSIALAFRYDRKIMVEQAIVGRELEVSVMGNDAPVTSRPGEVIPSAEFYDYNAKYISDSVLKTPAELSPEEEERLRAMAIEAYRAIDCCGLGRVDFFLSDKGEVLVNEINTMPGFTQSSMYPRMWEASGLSYTNLITSLISLAFERFEEKRRISVELGE
jgi:D-alanine-D-alanine ligase